jgi:hypothetical protein
MAQSSTPGVSGIRGRSCFIEENQSFRRGDQRFKHCSKGAVALTEVIGLKPFSFPARETGGCIG